MAHLTDLHATPARPERLTQLFGKRLLGWLSWQLRRRKNHRPEVLEALIDDLAHQNPDQIVITGDLTNISCDHEFVEAREWLRRLGDPRRVSLVPGNHDAYVRIPYADSWAHWSDYMDSDPAPDAETKPTPGEFPTLRIRAGAAVVGICSALPTPPLFASGRVGAAQLERLEALLTELADTDLCRIVLVHHPPDADAVSKRRALDDGEALRGVLRRAGADLVLHGHAHRTRFGRIPGPQGPIPVIGARSSSDVGHKPDTRAQYHVYSIERGPGAIGGARFHVTVRIRGFDPATGRFAAEGEKRL